MKELSKGGKLVWIAPSGGRDRPDADTGAWLPHKYDAGKLLTKNICEYIYIYTIKLSFLLYSGAVASVLCVGL